MSDGQVAHCTTQADEGDFAGFEGDGGFAHNFFHTFFGIGVDHHVDFHHAHVAGGGHDGLQAVFRDVQRGQSGVGQGPHRNGTEVGDGVTTRVFEDGGKRDFLVNARNNRHVNS